MTATIKEMRDQFEIGTAQLIEIDIPERQRKDYGDIDELSKSIKESCGLIQPLAVQRQEQKDGSKVKYRLLAGGRRFLACMQAGLASVPVRIYPQNLDQHQQALIENIENVYRKDFTVEESLRSAEAIHNAQTSIYGEKISRNNDDTGWSQKMTAELLNMNPGQVSDMLTLARASKSHPEISKAKNMSEAKKIYKTHEAKKKKTARASEITAKAKGEDASKEKNTLCECYQVLDCLEGMAKLPPKSFNLVEIDPPYAMDYANARRKDGSQTTMDYNEIDEGKYIAFMDKVIGAAKGLMKDDSWLILWHSNEWERNLHKILENYGFSCRILPAIWHKVNTAGTTAQPKRYLSRGYEQFLYASLGSPQIYNQGRSDVFAFKGVHSAHRSHPTERPVELMQEVLNTFTEPGSSVLVPFAGSGNTLLAATNSYMTSIGFDLSKIYKDTFIIKVHEGEYRKYTSYKENKNA